VRYYYTILLWLYYQHIIQIFSASFYLLPVTPSAVGAPRGEAFVVDRPFGGPFLLSSNDTRTALRPNFLPVAGVARRRRAVGSGGRR
jgi:hypothetical protein